MKITTTYFGSTIRNYDETRVGCCDTETFVDLYGEPTAFVIVEAVVFLCDITIRRYTSDTYELLSKKNYEFFTM